MSATLSTTAPPPPPPAGQLSHRRVLIIFGGLMLGMLLAALDQTIVATALPTIVGHLGGVKQLSLVVTAYLITSTVCTPLFGKVSDLVGRKPLFILAIVVFLVGSVLSGLSQTMGQLVLFRALQGIGGGGLMAMAQVIIGDIVSPRERGRYQGFIGSVFAVSTVVGPLLGGFIVDNASWRWVFYINVPIGIVALAVAVLALNLPAIARVKRSVDYWGAALLGGGITGVLLAVTWGGNRYPWTSATTLILGLGGLALLVAGIRQERHAAEPILPPRLFRMPNFDLSSATMFLVGMGMLGALVYLPEYLQVVHGVSATVSGLLLVPMMGGVLASSIGSGQLVSRFGRYKVFPVVGAGLAAIGMWLLSLMTIHSTSLVMSSYMIVLGLGLGMVMPTMITVVHNTVSYRDLGVGTAAMSFFRSMGGAFGVAIFGAIFTNRLVAGLSHNLPAGAASHIHSSALTSGPKAINALPPPIRHAVLLSFNGAIHDLFLFAVPALVIAFVVVWFLKEVPLRTRLTSLDDAEAPADAAAAAGAVGAAVPASSALALGETAAGDAPVPVPTHGRRHPHPQPVATHRAGAADGAIVGSLPDSVG
ncbi:MAG: MDR family MFS transporter [Acidimicrobiales bacterium]